MLNINDFIKRLEVLFSYYSITASAFADKIDVQRSGISHILSGRNKPSLDFILKIIASYPEVSLEWLISGKGEFLREDNLVSEEVTISNSKIVDVAKTVTASKPDNTEAKIAAESIGDYDKANNSTGKINIKSNVTDAIDSTTALTIESVTIFYSNGTFKNYNPYTQPI